MYLPMYILQYMSCSDVGMVVHPNTPYVYRCVGTVPPYLVTLNTIDLIDIICDVMSMYCMRSSSGQTH